jgi:hypothetical protein
MVCNHLSASQCDYRMEQQKSRANRATGNLRTQGKPTASPDVESEEEMGDEDKVCAPLNPSRLD